MNTFENAVATLASPEEAIQDYIGEQYLEWLLNYITLQVKSWPELKNLREVQPKIEKIRKVMLQRFVAAEAFLGGRENDPGFLGFAIANLSESPDPLAENALGILQQKKQEELSGLSSGATPSRSTHRELWLRLLKALEITEEEINRAEAKEVTRTYVAELSDIYSNSEWQTAMGAFLAHERAIPEEYSALAAMLKQNASLTTAALEVLNWHAGVDLKYVINTSHMLEHIVVDPESKQLVFDGVTRQLSARKEFYAGLLKYLES